MHACINDDITCLQLLLYHGADLTLSDNGGMTALHFAAKSSRNGDSVTMLLNGGAPINVKCGASTFTWYMRSVDRDLLTHHFTPLHFAALACNAAAVEQLLAYGADATLCDAKERTPLRLVMFFSQFVTVDHRDAYNRVRDTLKIAESPPSRRPFLMESTSTTPNKTPSPGPMTSPIPSRNVTPTQETVRVESRAPEEKEESLDELRTKLSGFRVTFSLQSEKLRKKLKKKDLTADDLSDIASLVESRVTGHIDSVVECVDNAIHCIDRVESRESARASSEFALHRVFSYASSHIGAQKGLWRKLAAELLKRVEGANVDDIIAYVWTHHTSEASACYELLAMWRIYTCNHPDHAARLKRALVEVSMSHDVIERIGLLARERLPPLHKKPATTSWSQRNVGFRRSRVARPSQACLFKTSCAARRDINRQSSATPPANMDYKQKKSRLTVSSQDQPDSSKSFQN